MTFKKEFKKQMVPEWMEAYMDYEGLKKILKEIMCSKEGNHQAAHFRSSPRRLSLDTAFSGLHLQNGHQQGEEKTEEQVIDVNALQIDSSRQIYKTDFHKGHEEGGEAETRFFRKLDGELNKVNTFYKDQVEAVNHEATLLDKQMEALIALRIKMKNPNPDEYMGSTPAETSDDNHQENASIGGPEVNPVHHTIGNTHHGEEAHGNYNKKDITDILEHVKINNHLQSPISTLISVVMDSKEEELSFNKEELRKVEGQLRLVFIEFYQKLLHLKRYSFMNLSAFSKIMKKYEKFGKTTTRAASEAYMRVVDNSYLGGSDEVTCLLERVESTFFRNFSHSNHRKGMKLLRPKVKREKHRVTCSIGFFSGCLIALLVATVLNSVSQRLMNKQEGTFYMENIFPLYSLFGYITLHIVMYAANTYFWKRYSINYPFIFGLKPETELGHREVLLLSTGLAVLELLGFLVNLHLEMNRRAHNYMMTASELVPVALVILLLLITFCPFDIIYRPSRFFFIRCLFRCICAPLYPVTFADFFLADQITSQFQAFRCFELYICYYGLGEHSRRQNKCQSRGIYNTLYFIVGVIPYWFRLAQCMRQFYDNRDISRAFNALNYLSIIVAMVLRTAFELKKGKTWMVLALISSAVAVLWNMFWDIVMDWGLLRRHSKNPYLRDKLAVPHKSVYYAAMVLDILLRLSWMQLVVELNWRSLHKVAMTTIISCLEIIRRGIWNFFRLENENLNNVGKYRAFKSVPHPFSYYEEENEKND